MENQWAARFSKTLSKDTNDFNSSIDVDNVMFREDIEGSIAHAKMLGLQGIITLEDSEKIVEGLQCILKDLESGELTIDPNAEDIHMFVESVLTNRLGEAGKRLHTARSRNDQVALDVRLFSRKKINEIIKELKSLLETLTKLASEHISSIMPCYTHLQRAQPSTLGHYFMAYANMFVRDIERLKDCYKRLNVSPLGSCALAGTTYPIDRFAVAKYLNMSGATANSMDGVSDRDFAIEAANDIALIMMHLSRFSEEIILWCSTEFKFVELDDAYSTGSSIMPQKKNPDIAELVRGKTGRAYGNLIALLTVMKALPLAYNKDM
ncbi:argininosuccinate lyase, partial [bacterium]|nr:argininosuccinate lyase [bacterium]